MGPQETRRAYAYQPGPRTQADRASGRIFGIGGPGTEPVQFVRWATKEEAEQAAERVNQVARNGFLTHALPLSLATPPDEPETE